MTAITLVLGDRLALALLLAESDSVTSMPEDGKQFQDDFERGLSHNIAIRVDQLRDDGIFRQLSEMIKANPDFAVRLRTITTASSVIRALAAKDLARNIANDSLRLVPSTQPASGDYCVVASMKFAVAMLYLRLAHPDDGESMKDWTKAARDLFNQFQNDASGALFGEAVKFIEAKQPDGPKFVSAQVLMIFTRMLEERFLSGDDIGSMLGSGELTIGQY